MTGPARMSTTDYRQFMTASELCAEQAKPKRRKYANVPTTVDGIRFASKAEAVHYGELKMREKAGEIGGLELQRRFPLLAPNGEVIATYVADFTFWDHKADRFRVIDVKGGRATQTDSFRMKKRMMRAMLGIEVEIVGRGVKS